MVKKLSLFFVAALFLASVCFAQSGTTGALNGTVSDPDGANLPGITVTLTSPALVVSQMTTVSNAEGKYRFPALPPGSYDVTFELEGMNTLVRKGIVVNLGKTATVDVKMELKTQTETIVVSGKAPTVDRQTTTKSANMDIQFLEYIPALRTLGSYLNFTPGATSDSIHGGSVRDTSFNLDGLNLADPVVGTQGVFFGLDIMEEISVETGGLSAEYGQARGAVLNVVSKSGGNKFSGSASVYYRHESLQSDNTTGTPLEGEKSGYKYELEPGITLGGPIAKDKVWFFLNLSMNQREQNISGYPYDEPTEVPSDDKRPYPYLKFTYQPNQANKFVFSYNYSDIVRNHRGASRYDTVATTRTQVTPTHVFNLHWTRSFGANFFMNFKAGGYYSTFDMETKNKMPNYYDAVTGLNTGSYEFSDYNQRHRLQINTDGTAFIDDLAGSHELKFGGEFLYAWSGRQLTFSDISDGHGFNLYYTRDYYGPYDAVWYAPYDVKENAMNIALFLQDNWSISNNLTLNLGLRFEHQIGIVPKQGASPVSGDFGFIGYPSYTWDRSVNEKLTAMTWTTLSPRVSLIYDIMSDGTTLFKASFARYFMANITQWFSGLNPNGFLNYSGYTDNSMTGNVPLGWVTGIGTPNPNTLGWKNHDLQAPYMDEFTVGVERELFEDWSVSLRYIKKWDRKLLEDAAINQLDMDALMDDGELVWTNWEQVTATDPYDGKTVTFWNRLNLVPGDYATVNPPGAERDYDGFEVVLNKRYSNGWQLNVSYVWQDSRGLIGTDFGDSWGGAGYYDNPNNHTNAYGRFLLERRHQFKLTGMVKGPWGINLGTYFRFLSGQRYTRQIRNVDLGLSLSQGGTTTINAEPRGSRGYPDLAILDLKVEKAFKIGPVNIRAFVDIFNVLNGNKATGYNTTSSHPTQVFERMTTIENPRIFRLGAKIEF
jgi:hypothetical protein